MREGTTEVKGAVSMVMESPTAPEVVTMMGEFSAISLGERPLRERKGRESGWMDGQGGRERAPFPSFLLFESEQKSTSSSTGDGRSRRIEPQVYLIEPTKI